MLKMTAATRRILRTGTALASGALAMLGSGALAQALPDGGAVVVGTAAITYDVTDASDSTMVTVDIQTPAAVVDWNTFNVGNGRTAAFTSPELVADRAILNRVTAAFGASQIDGAITAQDNIAVWLVNPNGITYGSTGTFSGGSLVLSTLGVDNYLTFDGGVETLSGSSVNPITISNGANLSTNNPNGKIVLVAQQVVTAGNLAGGSAGGTGAVALVAASKANVTVAPSSPLSIGIVEGTTISDAKLVASGTIDGSSVYLVATSQSAMIDDLLQVSSDITATADGGGVYLMTAQDAAVPEVTIAEVPLLPGDPTTIDDGILLSGTLRAIGSGGEVFVNSAGATSLAGTILTGDPAAGPPVVGGDVTLKSVGALTSSAAVTAGGNVTITGLADVTQSGAVGTGGNYTVSGVNVLLGGATAVTQQATGNISVTATDGQIVSQNLTLTGGGTVFLDTDTGGASAGDIVIDDRVVAGGNLTIESARDVRIAPYDAATDSGVLRSTGGNVTITAQRSVYGIGGSDSDIIAERGYYDVEAFRDLTVLGDGDVVVNSLTAGRDLTLDIDGGLAGYVGAAPTPLGGAIFAPGGGGAGTGDVTITTGPTGTNVISLDRIEAGDTVALTADKVAVGLLSAPNATITAPEFFVGRRYFPLDGTLQFPDNGAVLTNHVTTQADGIFFPGYGRTDLTAGQRSAGGAIDGDVGYGAQLDAVLASGSIALRAAGIVGGRVESTGNDVGLTARFGTLQVDEIRADGLVDLDKQLGLTSLDGDELRVRLISAGTGAELTSSTHVRLGGMADLGGVTSDTGNVVVAAATGDISGFRTSGAFERLPTVSPQPLSGGGLAVADRFDALSDNYAKADLVASLGTLDIDAPLGGVQLGNAVSGTDVLVDALAITIDYATAGQNLALTASDGTLHLGVGLAGQFADLAKGGVTLGDDGNELRAWQVLAGTGIDITSTSHVRLGSASDLPAAPGGAGTDTGDLTVSATGDISGFRGTGGYDRLATVSTGPRLSDRYGVADLRATLGAVAVDIDADVPGTGTRVQLGSVTAGSDVLVDAQALTVGTLDAGRDATLTATLGTLYLGTGTVGRTSVLTKQGGSAATDGDDLRVATLTGGTTTDPGGIVLDSSTSVRAGTVTAQRGDLVIDAAGGDVSGFLTGTFERLPTVSTGTVLSTNYGVANLASTLGNVSVQAANGAAQLGNVSAAIDITVGARAISLDNLADDAADENRATADARAGRDLSLTASLGTLHLSSGAAGRAAYLVKQGGSIGTLGDELRVHTLWTTAPNGSLAAPLNTTSVQLSSQTHVRADRVVADSGNIAATAITGDISGRLTGTATPSHLDPDFVTTGIRFNDQYGVANLAATLGSITVQSLAGEAQLGRIAAGTDVSVTAKGITLDDLDGTTTDLTAGRDATLTATTGTLYLGSGTVGRTTVLTKQGGSIATPGDDLRLTSLTGGTTTAPGGITLDSSTDVRATTVTAQRGDLTVRARTGSISGQNAGAAGAVAMTAAGDIAYTEVTAGTSAALTAGRDIGVGTVGAGTSATLNAGLDIGVSTLTAGTSIGATAGRSIAVTSATAGTTLAMNAVGGTLSLGTGTATGDVTLASLGKATLGTAGMAGNAITTSGTTISLTASDAAIHGGVATGGQTGSRITVVDRSTGANLLRLGTTQGGGQQIANSTQDIAGSFTLTQDEINRFSAATLVLDAGTTAGLKQDVLIGGLTLGPKLTDKLSSFQINAQQRIDVVGTFTWATGANSALRLGGTSANVNEKATVLRVATNPTGTAGRIDVGMGLLELRAGQIGVGQDAGFLSLLGVTPGSSPSATFTPTFMVGNSGSPLYNANAFGGSIYAPNGPSLINAGTLTVRYTNFALFQNTGILGLSQGVALASESTPARPALQLFGPNPPDAGPFAMFGTVNGIPNAQAAVLPVNTGDANSVINLTAVDRTTARINGCIIGSTGGCISINDPGPTLGSISQSRTRILLPETTFELPFDPLVGTNNDSLFGDVGTFGLGDIPIAPLECEKNDETGCEPVKEDDNK